jgi:hypothetical protein
LSHDAARASGRAMRKRCSLGSGVIRRTLALDVLSHRTSETIMNLLGVCEFRDVVVVFAHLRIPLMFGPKHHFSYDVGHQVEVLMPP